jgi:hypothetical protein
MSLAGGENHEKLPLSKKYVRFVFKRKGSDDKGKKKKQPSPSIAPNNGRDFGKKKKGREEVVTNDTGKRNIHNLIR